MSNAKKKADASPVASLEEIRQAFEALSGIELARLSRFARWRMRALGSRQMGRDADEFVSEALLALLQGDRKWRPENVSFYVCFKEIIRSQTYNLRTKQPDNPLDGPRAPWGPADEDGIESDPLEKIESRTFQDQERALEWEQTAELIKTRFADDEEGALVLEARLDGSTPTEIRDAFGFSQSQYETVIKRVRRAVWKIVYGGTS
jgi:DNA-directed RNA polymerase specialized sigma24 family protein